MEDGIEIISETISLDKNPPRAERDRNGSSTGRNELPGKLNDCRGKIIQYSHSMQSGVLRIETQDGSVFCLFHSSYLFNVDMDRKDNISVCCDAWLMQETSYIPYMASLVWEEESSPPEKEKQRIRSNPTPNDMDVYSEVSEDLARLLKRSLESSRDNDDRKSHRKYKKAKKRSRSRERRRSRSDDRHSSDRDDRFREDRKKHKRDHSRERRRKNHDSKERRFREESPDRSKYRDRSLEGEEDGHYFDDNQRARFPIRGRMRGRAGRFSKGGPGRLSVAAVSKPKLAIGRNVFQDSDEEKAGGAAPPIPIRARGRGRLIRIGRGALPAGVYILYFLNIWGNLNF